MKDNSSLPNTVCILFYFLFYFDRFSNINLDQLKVFVAIFKFTMFQFLIILNYFRTSNLVVRNIKDFGIVFNRC